MDKNKIMMIVIIVLLIALLSGIVWVAVLITRIPNSTNQPQVSQSSHGAFVNPRDLELIHLSEPITTNLLTDTDGVRRNIRIDISLGINNSKKKESTAIIELLTSKELIVRDIVLSIVRNKTYDELNRPDGKDILREEILRRLQETFETNLIVTVQISDLILL